jgi:nicotinate-nucleotide adenylyltransferase
MDRWERPAELLRLAQLGVVHRAGHPAPDLEATRELLAPEDRAQFQPRSVSMPAIEISSTDLRARIAAGQSIRFRTPRAIEDYIRDTGLYR